MADLETSILIKVLDAFTGPLRKLDTELAGVGETASKIEKKMQLAANLNQAAEAAGRLGNALVGPLKSSVQEFASFEKSMSNVAALSDQMKGSDGFERMKEQALELGAATAYSSQEAADAMAVYAQAGRKVDEILKLTPMTLATAKANNLGLAETASIVNHTMKQMNIEASNAAHVMDVLTAAAAASDMNLQDMGTAMAYVGPVANQAGMSLELTAAMLGKMKDAGLEASSVGVGMRAVLTRLLDPSKEATRALGQLGFSGKAIKQMQKDVASGKVDEALRRIGAAADKLPNEQRMKLMSQIFGMEAQTAATIAIKAASDVSTDGVRAAAAAYEKADGTANRLATVMGDNLDGAMERASGALSGLKTSVGEVLAPTVQSMAEGVESAAGKLQKWVVAQPKAAKATAEMVAGVAGTAVAMQGVLTVMSSMTSAAAMAQKSFEALSKSMVGRFGLVGAAALVGYEIGQWANEVFKLSDKLSALFGRDKPEGSSDKPISNGAQDLPGGWQINAAGEVTKWGDPALTPRQVREAQAVGFTSQGDINTYLRRKRAAPQAFQVVPSKQKKITRVRRPQTMLEQGAARLGELSTPMSDVPMSPLVWSETMASIARDRTMLEQQASMPPAYAPNAPTEIPRIISASTQEQTEQLLKALERQEDIQSQLLDVMKQNANQPGYRIGVPH